MLPHPANSSSELEGRELIYCTSSEEEREREFVLEGSRVNYTRIILWSGIGIEELSILMTDLI